MSFGGKKQAQVVMPTILSEPTIIPAPAPIPPVTPMPDVDEPLSVQKRRRAAALSGMGRSGRQSTILSDRLGVQG